MFHESGRNERPSATAREEIRGVPFRVRLPDGRSVRLHPEDLLVDDQPRAVTDLPPETLRSLGAAVRKSRFWPSSPFSEVTLAPGDEVEAAGMLSTVVDPTGEAPPSRGAPLTHVLTPPPDGQVWIRRRPDRPVTPQLTSDSSPT